MSIHDLEKRIQVLEDIEAIKRLKAHYARIIDSPSPEEVGKIMTENAVLNYDNLGVIKGRRAIADYFKRYPDIRSFRVHYFSQPEITVEGDRAFGRWYMWVPCSTGDGRAIWSSGYEEEKYEKVNGEWFIAEIKLISIFRTPYEEGWHKTRFVEED